MNFIYDVNNNIIGEVIIKKGYRYSIHYGDKETRVFKIPLRKQCGMYKAEVFNSLADARQWVNNAN